MLSIDSGRKKNLEEMSVDDFLDGGFLTADIPDSAPTKNTASSKKGTLIYVVNVTYDRVSLYGHYS